MKRVFKLYLLKEFSIRGIMILTIVCILIGFVFYLNFQQIESNKEYILHKEEYIYEYKSNSIFMINIINLALISFYVGTDTLTSEQRFDILFPCQISKPKIYLIKLFCHIIILEVIVALEFILLELFPLIFYYDYSITLKNLNYIVIQSAVSIFLLVFGELLIIKINHFLVAFMVFVIGFGSRILCDVSEEVKEMVSLLFPQVEYSGEIRLYYGIEYVILQIILLSLLGMIEYSKKEYDLV